MKRIYHVLLALLIGVISFECQKELSAGRTFPAIENNQSSPVAATLQGKVLDENDLPAAGVKISVGSKTGTTDSKGYFRITDALLDKNTSLATAELPGYFRAYRSFRATTGVNQVVIKLIKKVFSGTINSATGGEVALANGAKVALPPNSVIKAMGAAYTGSIQVYAAYIDPTSPDINNTVPGSLMGDDRNKNRVLLSSYGMLAVELESSGGEKLQIKSGEVATLTMPIPLRIVSSAPASIALWYVDEQTGAWKEQGSAQKNGSNYVGTVEHFSFWNCDISVPAISLSATFKTDHNIPLANLNVGIRRVNSDTFGSAHGYTDSLGQVSGLVPASENLVMEVFDQCGNVVHSKNIGPFLQNPDLGTITILSSMPSLITLKGQLLAQYLVPIQRL